MFQVKFLSKSSRAIFSQKNSNFFQSNGKVKWEITRNVKPRLHDSHFGYGTLKFWHADPRFLVRLLRLHDEIFVLKILGSARLNWERHS